MGGRLRAVDGAVEAVPIEAIGKIHVVRFHCHRDAAGRLLAALQRLSWGLSGPGWGFGAFVRS